jgi:plasmid stabilization system protein ParE
MKLRFTNNALDNLEELLFYIEFIEYSPVAAKKVKTKIIRVIKKNILFHPLSFRECDEISTKTKIYRKALCSPYWIIYKVKPFEIIILGFIHTSQAPSKTRALRRVK